MLEIVPLLSLGLNIMIIIISAAGFIKIIKNDLTHVKESLNRMEKNQNKMNEKLDSTAERVSCIEGKLEFLEK